MRNKRIITMLMTVLLLVGNLGFTGAVRAAETEAPKVVISAVNVTDDGTDTGKATGYLEVSLLVQAKDFQTAGVVLSYDTDVLTAVDWNTPANAPTLTDNWTTVIPTKGVDDISGKPALARLEEKAATPEGSEDEASVPEGSAKRGFLYLGAESLRYQDLSEDATRLVTVRFKIARDGTSGYKAVSVAEASDLTDTSKTLCLAPEAVAEAAIPGAQVLLTLGEQVEDDTELNEDALDGYLLKYYAWRTTTANYEANKETACEVSFETKRGPSVNTGAAQGSGGGYAITFFDWDGRVIDAISVDPDTAQTSVSDWEDANQGRLTNKPGYAFDAWLVVYENNDGKGLVTENDTFTSNDTKLAAGNTDVADFDNLFKEDAKSVFLQAAYYATEDVNEGMGVAAVLTSSKTYYTFSEPTFYQYGSVDANNGQYAVRYTVTRGSALRARTPVVMALVYVGTQYLTVKVDLENTDTTNFEVVVPKGTTSIQCQVLDASTNAAWIFGRPRNEFSASANAKIVKNGAFDRLMDEAVNAAKSGTWSTDVNMQIFADAGYTGVNTTAKLTAAQTALKNAVTANGGNKLTDAQANAALSTYGSFTRVK